MDHRAAASTFEVPLVSKNGSRAKGKLTFADHPGGVLITGEVRGLRPFSRHGFHIHEFGDCSAADASSAGDHWHLKGQRHGGLDDPSSHLGDLGNLEADAQGIARVMILKRGLTLRGKNPVLGKSIIVHSAPDDLRTQPTGTSGDRIACGVIR